MRAYSRQILNSDSNRLWFAAISAALCWLSAMNGLGLAQVPAVEVKSPASSPAVQALPVKAPATQVPAPATRTEIPHVGSGRFMVVLDAAHGGDDGGGSLSGGTAEKTVTLALSVRLRSLLAARGFQVLTTREGNVNVSTDARAQVANRLNAAACLSLHASETGSGVHIFVSSLEPREQTRFMAWKTAQGAFVTRSLKLASVVNSAFEHTSIAGGTDAGGLGSGTGPIPATLGRTALPGVDSMECPAVALELAPIRGADRRIVTDVTNSDYQTQVVEALAAAVLEWRTDWDTERQPDSHSDARQNGGKLP